MSLTSLSRSRRFFWFWAIFSLASATALEPAWILLSMSWMSRGMASRTSDVACDFGIQVLKLDDFVEVNIHIASILFWPHGDGPTRIRTWDLPVMSRWLYH